MHTTQPTAKWASHVCEYRSIVNRFWSVRAYDAHFLPLSMSREINEEASTLTNRRRIWRSIDKEKRVTWKLCGAIKLQLVYAKRSYSDGGLSTCISATSIYSWLAHICVMSGHRKRNYLLTSFSVCSLSKASLFKHIFWDTTCLISSFLQSFIIIHATMT